MCHFSRAAVLGAMLAAAITPIAAQNFDCPQVERQVKLTAQTTVTSVSLGQTVNYGVFVEPVNNTPDPTGTIQLVVDTTNLGTFNLKQSRHLSAPSSRSP